MKQAAVKSTPEILHKIEAIEKELMDLKLSVLKKLTRQARKVYLSRASLRESTSPM
jgi:hypothetical protein